VRFLDNVIDLSRYPLEQQAQEARAKRRIGLGVTGLADALIFLGLSYGSAAARETAARWMAIIQNAAYRARAALAAEKGPFPLYDANAFLAGANIARLDKDVRDAIAANGIRNGCLTSIAPTGTISLLAGNVSSGVEPVFDFVFRRRVLGENSMATEETVEDFAHRTFRDAFGDDVPLPETFVTAETLTPSEHVAMQAALQPYVDSAISKTINCPEDISFESFRDIYLAAYESGLKGCTTYRPNAITGAVLSRDVPPVEGAAGKSGAAMLQKPSGSKSLSEDPETPGVVYMTKPLERDAALEGVTYKIKWPASAHALYVTINDIVRDGRRRPFEVFINTKNLEHYAWTVALTRMISAVFRRGGDVAFVAEELKAVFDPEGGRWMGGRYVPSLLAAIGDVIEEHMLRIGFLTRDETHGANDAEAGRLPVSAQVLTSRAASDPQAARGSGALDEPHAAPISGARVCPRCGDRALRRVEGCWTCASCTYSRCG
jgi:ribonucleoside-diphosphate reductase alpha chain